MGLHVGQSLERPAHMYQFLAQEGAQVLVVLLDKDLLLRHSIHLPHVSLQVSAVAYTDSRTGATSPITPISASPLSLETVVPGEMMSKWYCVKGVSPNPQCKHPSVPP